MLRIYFSYNIQTHLQDYSHANSTNNNRMSETAKIDLQWDETEHLKLQFQKHALSCTPLREYNFTKDTQKSFFCNQKSSKEEINQGD